MISRAQSAVFGAVCATLIGCASPELQVHGHRGARAVYPENTLPAFAHAIEAGADFLELDLGVTRDGSLVVCHDPRLNPKIHSRIDRRSMRERPALLRQLSLAQVKEYDAGSLRDPSFPRQQVVPGTLIPTLQEVFALVANSKHPNARRIRFNIETKIDPGQPNDTVGPREFAMLVVNAISGFRNGMFSDRVVLQSFDPRVLSEARTLAPRLPRSLLVADEKIDMLATAERVGAQIISPQYEFGNAPGNLTTADLVARAHATGRDVVPWTANTAKEWEELLGMKVDGIITDDPAGLLAFLGRTVGRADKPRSQVRSGYERVGTHQTRRAASRAPASSRSRKAKVSRRVPGRRIMDDSNCRYTTAGDARLCQQTWWGNRLPLAQLIARSGLSSEAGSARWIARASTDDLLSRRRRR